MSIDEPKRAKEQHPFQLLRIRMTNGREIEIKDPDAVAWGNEPCPGMVFGLSDGEHHWIDIPLVFSLVLPKPADPRGSNGGTLP